MSDDCGAMNIIGGSSFDYSCDTQTSNDYSSVNDCTSNVPLDNDCSREENTSLAVKNLSELNSKTEESASNELQANEVTTRDEFLKSQSIQDVPSSSNYVRRSGRMGNNYSSSYALAEASRIREREERLKNLRIQNEQNKFRRTFCVMFIVTIVIAFLFILMIYVIIFINYPIESIYKHNPINPLPEEA